jgi:hypothetical protein
MHTCTRYVHHHNLAEGREPGGGGGARAGGQQHGSHPFQKASTPSDFRVFAKQSNMPLYNVPLLLASSFWLMTRLRWQEKGAQKEGKGARMGKPGHNLTVSTGPSRQQCGPPLHDVEGRDGNRRQKASNQGRHDVAW